ncbi:unnamed protein product [Mycena citricolor]|uniref:Uncharacterized protein n=2 Tax=Mycena citricolor TaxID=2018698 RepID=A0AAD2H6B6_9AGAR|nr:unnamed protein product [Mycena citricolor]
MIVKKPKEAPVFNAAILVHTAIILAFVFSVLITAPIFGNNVQCNTSASAVMFRPFPFLQTGRIISFIITGVSAVLFIGMIIRDYTNISQIVKRAGKRLPGENPVSAEERHPMTTPPRSMSQSKIRPPRHTAGEVGIPRPGRPSSYDDKNPYALPVDWNLLIRLIALSMLWLVGVLNIELLIRFNFPSTTAQAAWQFGQILAILLVIIPLRDLIRAFKEHGIRPKRTENVTVASRV